MPVVTQKEVLRLAANWVRIMSAVSQPNASEKHLGTLYMSKHTGRTRLKPCGIKITL